MFNSLTREGPLIQHVGASGQRGASLCECLVCDVSLAHQPGTISGESRNNKLTENTHDGSKLPLSEKKNGSFPFPILVETSQVQGHTAGRLDSRGPSRDPPARCLGGWAC